MTRIPFGMAAALMASLVCTSAASAGALMKVGVRRGRIIVVRPEHDHGSPAYGPKRPRTYVYRRTGEPCRICGAAIRTAEMEGRNLFWCPVCQT